MYPIAVNRKQVNKITHADPRSRWNEFNGEFVNEWLSADDLIRAIQDGYAYAPWHRHYRKAENFLQAQHVALDFDTKDERSSLATLANHPFIASYATFLTTTATHSPETPKARAVFLLDRPIRNRQKYEDLYDGLVEMISYADTSCRDATRFFFGAKDCEVVRIGNILTLEDAGEVIVKPHREREAKKEEARKKAREEAIARYGNVKANDHSKANYINRVFEKAEEKVRLAGSGERHHTLLKMTRHLAGFLNASWVPLGLVDEARIRDAMMSGSIANGEVRDYGELNSETTIRDGIQYGIAKPYDEPPWRHDDKGRVVVATMEAVRGEVTNESVVVPIPVPTYGAGVWEKLFVSYQQIQNQLNAGAVPMAG